MNAVTKQYLFEPEGSQSLNGLSDPESIEGESKGFFMHLACVLCIPPVFWGFCFKSLSRAVFYPAPESPRLLSGDEGAKPEGLSVRGFAPRRIERSRRLLSAELHYLTQID